MNAKFFYLSILFSILVPFLSISNANAQYPNSSYGEQCEALGDKNCEWVLRGANELFKFRQLEIENERANNPENCSGKGCSTIGGYREPETRRNWWDDLWGN
jgi:hypothetical protein